MKITKLLLAGAMTATLMSISAFAFDVQGGTVETSSVVNFRAGASTSHDVLDKLSNGDRVCVLDEAENGWYKAAYNGIVGYVSSEYVTLSPVMNIEPGGAQVTTEVLNMRAEPSTSAAILTRLTSGNIAKIIGINNGWLKVTYGSYTGYIHPDYVEVVAYSATPARNASSSDAAAVSSTSSGVRQEIVDYAKTFLGVKYVYGGSSPKGFDCSGFTKYVFSHFNISLQRTSSAQYSTSVTKISKSELQPGDLVFFSSSAGSSSVGHVGIYIGNGNFIHASSPGDVVKIDSMDSTYYSTHYAGSGTVL